jgi:hypothetical protein
MIAGIYKMQYTNLGFEEIRKEMVMYGHDESFPKIIETVRKWRDTVKE